MFYRYQYDQLIYNFRNKSNVFRKRISERAERVGGGGTWERRGHVVSLSNNSSINCTVSPSII